MYRIKQLFLLAGDFIMLYAGLVLALLVRNGYVPLRHFASLLGPLSLLFLGAMIIMFIIGLYDLSRARNSWTLFQGILLSALVWLLIGIAYFYLNPEPYVTPKTVLLLTTFFGFGLVAFWRYVHNKFLSTNILKHNLIIAGLTVEAIELIHTLEREPTRGYRVIGIVNDTGPFPTTLPKTVVVASTFAALKEKIIREPIQMILVASPGALSESLLKELYENLFRPVDIIDLVQFYETTMGRIPPGAFSVSWFLTNLREQPKRIYDRLRTLLDYALALIMGLFFFVTFPFIAIAIRLNGPGKIFFRQERVGRAGRHFTMYKYRTMRPLSADGSAELTGPQYATVDDPRITRVGRFLRRTRLDEVPQFFNVVKGEMGIIGPRPERPEFVAALTAEVPYYALRHLIKPGLTGWAQLQRSYYGTLPENLFKLEYDLYYIKNRGPLLDLAILFRTINTLLRFAGR